MACVDVVIPCYNYARYLRSCVESALLQEGVEVRVLILDDASSDDTPRVCEALAARDPRVQVRRHTVNRGHIATYNEGLLEWASSPYSLLLSADDMLAPGALRRATEFMEQRGAVGMCYGFAQVFTDDVPVIAQGAPEVADQLELAGANFLRYCFENAMNPVPTPTAVVRTALQQKIGGYRRDLPHAGDLEMWMRFAAHSSIGVLRCVQAFYRRHDTNMSVRYSFRPLEDRRQVALACQEIIDQWGVRFADSASWLKSARQRLSMEALWSARDAFERGEDKEMQAWLDFAVKTYPQVRRSPIWWRVRAKRLLGLTLWHALRPALARFLASAPVTTADAEAGASFGALQGWWPGGT